MAAGLGFKTFTTGEVLTAADTNGYLMQGVLVFASSAARAAAITSPQEGQYSYLKDTNSTEYYDGAAWIAAPIGDITGVTAGTGISGGGTSGTVTITNSMATEITAKGDLIAGTGSATFDNLPVGTNGQTLVADSAEATGLKWAASGATFTTFTPAARTGYVVGNGVETAVTASVGSLQYMYYKFVVGTTSTVNGSVGMDPPAGMVPTYTDLTALNASFYDSSATTLFDGVSYYNPNGYWYPQVLTTGSTYSTLAYSNTTIPMNWNTSDYFIIEGWYRV